MVLAPLQFSGRGLTPDVLGGIQQGQTAAQGFNILDKQRLDAQQAQQQQAQAAELQQQAQGLLARSRGGAPEGEINAEVGQLFLKDPKLGKTLSDRLGINTEAKKLAAAKFGLNLEQLIGDTPAQNRLLEQRIKAIDDAGGDSSHTRELLDAPEARRIQAAKIFQANALNREELAKVAGKSIEQQRAPIDRTTLEKNLLAAGLVRGTPAFENAVKQILTKPTTSVQVGIKQEGKEREALAGVQAGRFKKIVDDGEAAGVTLANLDQLDAIDVDSGALAPAKAAFASVVKDLGFSSLAAGISDVSTAQSFDAVSGRLVQAVLNQATGPQTDDDAKRASKTISSLGDDPLARVFKSDSLRALAFRQEQRGNFISSRIDEGKTFSAASKEWDKFKNSTPNISGVVKGPNGLPLFFFQFEQTARSNKPNVTDEEILTAWRQAHGK